MRAWSVMFNEYLSSRGLSEPYTDQDYYSYVDGKPRYDGVRTFLASRDITLPDGTPDDDPSLETVAGLGNRKNDAFRQVLDTEGIQAYPGSVALLEYLESIAMKVAIVSSSRNATHVLQAAGLRDRFPVIVDGLVAAELGLAGKPSPATFHHAARTLGVADERAIVLEDAISGVQAGAEGGFAHVVGVDRGVGAEALTAAGADIVVTDLAELIPTA